MPFLVHLYMGGPSEMEVRAEEADAVRQSVAPAHFGWTIAALSRAPFPRDLRA